ncbi:7330_t:CDS:2 [Gigaspora rosea]|nr:7330_t:CDS:2 [Gigaspora rosea]
MNQPSIIISTDEELALVCWLLFYQPTGYHSNPRKLWKDLKAEGYQFPYKKVCEWLTNQNEWQKHAPPPKDTPRVSYGKITRPNCVHMCNLLRLTNDTVNRKTYKWALTVVDVASCFKYAVPLTSKNSSEIATAFKKIYDNPNIPLNWPDLLQCDSGSEFKKSVSLLMEAHNVTIRVIGPYSHRGLAIVDRFCKTLAEMLYKVQSAIETPGSKKWGLASVKAIRLDRVESRPSTKYKCSVGKDEEKLKKGDTVRYLLANAEWEGVICGKYKPHAPFLLQLYLSSCKVSNNTLYVIAELCPNLQYLKIRWCCGLSNKVISKIAQICHLESLDVSRITRIKNIKRFGKYKYMKDITLCKIAYLSPNLQYLKLGAPIITDISLRAVAHSCINLRHLKLNYNENITDVSIIEIAQNCPYLEYLGLWRSNITDASLKQIAKLCSKLHTLRLIYCPKITDKGIYVIASACSNMQKYKLEDCEEITDISVKKIAQSNPNLKYLNFVGCHLVSDESICNIVQSCPKLEQLYLEGYNITDVSMSALANLYNLQKLDIEDCEKVSTNAIITLQNKNPTLNIISWYSDVNSESSISL